MPRSPRAGSTEFLASDRGPHAACVDHIRDGERDAHRCLKIKEGLLNSLFFCQPSEEEINIFQHHSSYLL